MKHFVPFPGASPFLTATVLRPPSGQLPPPQYVYPVAYGGPVFGQRGCCRALPRAGRESGEHGSRGLWRMQWLWPVGPQEGGGPMHAERAAGTTACRIGTGPQRTGSLRSLLCARMVEAKKPVPRFGGTGRKSRLVKGRLREKSSRIDSRDATEWRPQAVPVATQEATGIDSRDATGWRPQAVPVATQEATGIDSRDATGWRPQAVPVSGKDASRDHRQRGGGSETQRRWRYGPDGHRRQDAG